MFWFPLLLRNRETYRCSHADDVATSTFSTDVKNAPDYLVKLAEGAKTLKVDNVVLALFKRPVSISVRRESLERASSSELTNTRLRRHISVSH